MQKNLLDQIFRATRFKVTCGAECLWKCFPDGTRLIDFSLTDEFDAPTACITFNTATFDVYEIELYDYKGNPKRWVNPQWLDVIKKAYEEKGLDFSMSSEDVSFEDIENHQEILTLIETIFRGTKEYDPSQTFWRCLACQTVWLEEHLYQDPYSPETKVCGDACCGGTVVRKESI